ncbi:MAG: flavodoxin family protein [Pseudomonadota bacterium]
MITVLGICGSPVKDSNTERLLTHALDSVHSEDVACSMVTLHSKTIQDCRQCNWCMGKQTPGRFCTLDDDMDTIFGQVADAHAVMIASPVYLGRMSGLTASLLDRLRSIHYGNLMPGGMKHKIGAALAVGWYRNSGIETTLTSIHWAFLTYQMLIAVPGSMSTFGGSGLSSLQGTGACDPKDRHQVLKDEYGMKTAKNTARSMVELARIIQAGKPQ